LPIFAVAIVIGFLILELRSSWFEAHVLAASASAMRFYVARGPSRAIHYPHTGPYDRRLGYADLPQFVRRFTILSIGGKTGTGDNRFKVYSGAGMLLGSRAVNRTAAFVFMIGDRFYGTVTAFVPGKTSASYNFTSALPVRVLKDLEPQLVPLVQRAERRHLWRANVKRV
jgi:hypothetical protein